MKSTKEILMMLMVCVFTPFTNCQVTHTARSYHRSQAISFGRPNHASRSNFRRPSYLRKSQNGYHANQLRSSFVSNGFAQSQIVRSVRDSMSAEKSHHSPDVPVICHAFFDHWKLGSKQTLLFKPRLMESRMMDIQFYLCPSDLLQSSYIHRPSEISEMCFLMKPEQVEPLHLHSATFSISPDQLFPMIDGRDFFHPQIPEDLNPFTGQYRIVAMYSSSQDDQTILNIDWGKKITTRLADDKLVWYLSKDTLDLNRLLKELDNTDTSIENKIDYLLNGSEEHEIIPMLIHYGADRMNKESEHLALRMAAMNGDDEYVSLLLSYNDVKLDEIKIALERAVSQNRVSTATILLKHFSLKNDPAFGRQLMKTALFHTNIQMVRLMLENGIKVAVSSSKERDIIDWAWKNGHRDLAASYILKEYYRGNK